MKNGWFSIRNILLVVNLVILALLIGIIYFLRLYDNQLVRRTESELIMQAAFIEAIYKSRAVEVLGGETSYGRRVHIEKHSGEYYEPVSPKIDLSEDRVLDPRPDAMAPELPPDPVAAMVGESIAPLLIEAQKKTLAGIRVLDFNGIAVAGREEVGLSFAHMEEVRGALGGAYDSVLRKRVTDEPEPPLTSISRRANIRVFIALPIILNDRLAGVVYLSRTPESLTKNIYINRNKFLIAGAFILALTLVVGFVTSYAITRPLSSLVVQAGRVIKKEVIPPLKRPVPAEISLLSESIIEMAKTVESRSEYIRNFAMHLSHEFKTPIASIQGTVELLTDHVDEMHEVERKKFLDNVMHDSWRLRRLVERLLELARADMLEPVMQRAEIGSVMGRLNNIYKNTGMRIGLDKMTPEEAVPIGAEVLVTVLKNLLDNSLHNGGTEAMLSFVDEKNDIVIRVRDNGAGITEANLKSIFTPFFTTNRKKGGTGLGLSIVKSIVDAHRGTINVESRTGESTTFTLRFPRS